MAESGFYKQKTLPDLTSEGAPAVLPSKIGPYPIESLISQGGMSFLYLGLDPETKLPLAIKVLPPEHLQDAQTVERFLKEARIIQMASHPNIVKLFGEGRWEQGLYIAMEFIPGISLRQFITQQSLSLKRSLEIILQVAYALHHLHTHGVIHRDLKPENILITENGEIKVIDFGIAQLPGEPETRVIGTPSYMSPEQRENHSQSTFASDIYSLGVIAYELILGRPSYGVIQLSLLPQGIRAILSKALAVSTDERYPEITPFIADISQYMKSKEIERERPSSDQLKEIYEALQKAALSLAPASPPQWSSIDFGLAKFKGQSPWGLYTDFFRLPNNTFLIALARTETAEIENALHIALFQGIFRTLIHERTPDPRVPFPFLRILQTLDRYLSEDQIRELFGLSLLLLDPIREELHFTSCGLSPLYHLPQGSKTVRILATANPHLGSHHLGDFSVSTDNWNVGDQLLFHSIESDLDDLFRESFVENALLSAQRQAELLLKRITGIGAPLPSYPKALIALQRIS